MASGRAEGNDAYISLQILVAKRGRNSGYSKSVKCRSNRMKPTLWCFLPEFKVFIS